MLSPTSPSPTEGSLILNQAFPLTIKEKDVAALQCYICPTCPSPAEGSLILNQAFPLTIKGKGCNRATRCSEPLRSKVGGTIKGLTILCGMGPPDYIAS